MKIGLTMKFKKGVVMSKREYRKKGGVAEQVDKKTNLTLVKFCDIHKLPYNSLLNGYYSKRTKKILEKYGIKVA
ncbi:MAG: hypothetical protein SPI03_01665 [Campylobacter sputorum]|uniref:hypothetical protein n=1 Tax=Campylobacter sputorum TaxID=206 RepID=UPI002A91AEA8|nr:hypothetical protein [Campylobacter sputorum]MDY6120037.1 hypothetical protein [Campylobacter sputorum]